jgi:hypothetical protein
MQAPAQPLPEVSPVPLDLTPPVRAESIDLRVLNLDQPTESLLDAIINDVYKSAGSKVLMDDVRLVAAEL